MKEHFEIVNPDVVSMSEVDACVGKCSEQYFALMKMMAGLGYVNVFQEKSSGMSAQAIFYKKKKFNALEGGFKKFEAEESQYFVWVLLETAAVEGKVPAQFVVTENHLKAKPPFMD